MVRMNFSLVSTGLGGHFVEFYPKQHQFYQKYGFLFLFS